MSAAIKRDRVHCATMIHLGMKQISMHDLAPERKRNGQMLTLRKRDGENTRIEETTMLPESAKLYYVFTELT